MHSSSIHVHTQVINEVVTFGKVPYMDMDSCDPPPPPPIVYSQVHMHHQQQYCGVLAPARQAFQFPGSGLLCNISESMRTSAHQMRSLLEDAFRPIVTRLTGLPVPRSASLCGGEFELVLPSWFVAMYELSSPSLMLPPQSLAHEGIHKHGPSALSMHVGGCHGYKPPPVPPKKEKRSDKSKKMVISVSNITPEAILDHLFSAFDILEAALRDVMCFCDEDCHPSDAARCKDMAFINGACVLTLFLIHAGLYGQFCGYDMHCLAKDMNVLLKAKPRPLHRLALDIEDARRVIGEMCHLLTGIKHGLLKRDGGYITIASSVEHFIRQLEDRCFDALSCG